MTGKLASTSELVRKATTTIILIGHHEKVYEAQCGESMQAVCAGAIMVDCLPPVEQHESAEPIMFDFLLPAEEHENAVVEHDNIVVEEHCLLLVEEHENIVLEPDSIVVEEHVPLVGMRTKETLATTKVKSFENFKEVMEKIIKLVECDVHLLNHATVGANMLLQQLVQVQARIEARSVLTPLQLNMLDNGLGDSIKRRKGMTEGGKQLLGEIELK